MIGTSDQSCWLAKACKTVSLHVDACSIGAAVYPHVDGHSLCIWVHLAVFGTVRALRKLLRIYFSGIVQQAGFIRVKCCT